MKQLEFFYYASDLSFVRGRIFYSGLVWFGLVFGYSFNIHDGISGSEVTLQMNRLICNKVNFNSS
jgi:hypothetical protein